jgi:uncharacterized membrane protein
MNTNWESSRRVLVTMAAILSIVAAALVMNIHTGRAWVIVGFASITVAAVLLHLIKPVAQTTSQAIHEARR